MKGAQESITGDREAVGGEVSMQKNLGVIKCNVPNTYTRVHGEGGAYSVGRVYRIDYCTFKGWIFIVRKSSENSKTREKKKEKRRITEESKTKERKVI